MKDELLMLEQLTHILTDSYVQIGDYETAEKLTTSYVQLCEVHERYITGDVPTTPLDNWEAEYKLRDLSFDLATTTQRHAELLERKQALYFITRLITPPTTTA
jgi:hypothetical protein